MPAPVGAEFKKTFEQQNFGLPLREAINELAERVPLLDVRFFVTAVLIQRETGGNLSEILDNLAHVVRERFKIGARCACTPRTAGSPATCCWRCRRSLAVALTFISPDHMKLLFRERDGPDDDDRRDRDADDRIHLDPQGHQDRGVV